jgi:hypothetical protein
MSDFFEGHRHKPYPSQPSGEFLIVVPGGGGAENGGLVAPVDPQDRPPKKLSFKHSVLHTPGKAAIVGVETTIVSL